MKRLVVLSIIFLTIFSLNSCKKEPNKPKDQQIQTTIYDQLNYLNQISQMQVNMTDLIYSNKPLMDSIWQCVDQNKPLTTNIEQLKIRFSPTNNYKDLIIPPLSFSSQQTQSFKSLIGAFLQNDSLLKQNVNQISTYLITQEYKTDQWIQGKELETENQKLVMAIKTNTQELFELTNLALTEIQAQINSNDALKIPEFLTRLEYLQINNILIWLNNQTIAKKDLTSLQEQVLSIKKSILKNTPMLKNSEKSNLFNDYQTTLNQQLNIIDSALNELLNQGSITSDTQTNLIQGQKKVINAFNAYLN
ncbi:hypothetical protein [Myroides sp. LJL119]